MRKGWIRLLLSLTLLFGLLAPQSVHAQRDPTFDQVLHVYKVLQKNKLEPLAEDAYKGTDGTDYKWKPAADTKFIEGVKFVLVRGEQTAKRLEDLPPDVGAVREAITNEQGVADISVNLLEPGKYTLYEDYENSTYGGDENEQLTDALAVPMVLDLPFYDENGIASDVNLYPKNLQEAPTIKKALSADSSNGFAVGEEFPYTITVTIPAHAKWKGLTVEDSYDEGLTFVESSTSVKWKMGAGEEQTLSSPTDYSEEHNLAVNPKNPFKLANWEFKEEVLKKFYDQPEPITLTLSYRAKINSSAALATPLNNYCNLLYGNNPNALSIVKADNDEAKTYGLKIKKVSADQKTPLPGAHFVLSAFHDGWLVLNENQEVSWTHERAKATEFTTKDDGTFLISGLRMGTYYLEETKAPNGYQLPAVPSTEVTVTETSHEDSALSNGQTIENVKVLIPPTGSLGTGILLLAGALFVGFGLFALRKNRQEG